MKLLLHTCCGPCATYPISVLKDEGIDITAFFYNPNIHPYTEYKSRLDSFRKLTEMEGIKQIIQYEYGLVNFIRNVCGKEDNRCGYCYYSRLLMTVELAKEKGFDAFSTTLLVSPYQKHELIIEVARKLAKEYGIEFYYKDFREGFRRGQELAREKELYMQKYCGCIYSEEDRYSKQINKLIKELERI